MGTKKELKLELLVGSNFHSRLERCVSYFINKQKVSRALIFPNFVA